MQRIVTSLWACVLAGVPAGISFAQDLPDTTDQQATHVHVVRARETLGDISVIYFGSTRYARRIADANGLTNPNRLQTGMRLTIPPRDGPLPPPAGPDGHAARPAEPPDTARADVRVAERIRAAGSRAGERLRIWWVIPLALILWYVFETLGFWIGSNIVHMQHMGFGRAVVAALLAVLVWIGCAVVALLVFVSSASSWDTARPEVLIGMVVVLVLGLIIGRLIVIKLVYRDTFGKTVALAVVWQCVAASCVSPFGWLFGA